MGHVAISDESIAVTLRWRSTMASRGKTSNKRQDSKANPGTPLRMTLGPDWMDLCKGLLVVAKRQCQMFCYLCVFPALVQNQVVFGWGSSFQVS